MVQLVPESVVKLWNEWELRAMVLSSLLLQIVLIILGSCRKYIARNWVRTVVWMAYLSADAIASVALGMITNFQGDDEQNSTHPNTQIMALWAPFLLVHLGGPDTITAYSMEDNELWLRHLLGLLVQVGLVMYILLRSWTGSSYPLALLAIPIFVAGVIKYGERTWVLRSASNEKQFRGSPKVLNRGKGYADFAAEYSAIKARGEEIGYSSTLTEGTSTIRVDPVIREAKYLHESYELFKIFRRLYADLILDYHANSYCSAMISDHSSVYVFKQVEVELSFMYDVLYTKASIVYSLTGVIFRSISLLCYVSTSIVFCLAIDKQLYSTIDITLTYLLSIGAITLELYAIVVLVSTDWTMYWLSKQKHPLAYPIYRAVSSFRSSFLSSRKRWSESIAQFNLMEFCLKEKPPKCAGIQRVLGIYEMSEKYWYTTFQVVPIKMKELICEQLKEAMSDQDAFRKERQEILKWRGKHVLQKNGCFNNLGWSVETQIEKSILLWHIATDLCFYNDDLDKDDEARNRNSQSKLSRLFSDYMMYIVVMRPLMLPKGIGEVRFEDTCAEAIEFFKTRTSKIKNGKGDACKVLLEVNTELDPEFVIGDRSKSVLFQGCRLAKQLQSLETEEGWTNEEKWEMISQVWIEILCYAASQCGWNHHAQQLRRGGELLTHVCLLMANFGLSQQFQITRGIPNVTISSAGTRRSSAASGPLLPPRAVRD